MRGFLQDSVFFGVFISLAAYELGLYLRSRWKLAIFNPLLVSVLLVMALLWVCRLDYAFYYEGARYLSYLLTPATVCLAVPLYEKIRLLRRHAGAIFGGILSGVLTSLISVFACAFLFGLTREQYVTLLPKSITAAIGMGISEELGGMVTITNTVILFTGVFGNMTARAVLKLFRIEEPVAKGIAVGTASHAMGTVKAMEMGEVEGAMSGLSIAVAGLLTVIGAPVFANFI